MNLPNKLTITRLILVPFMVISFYLTFLSPMVIPFITAVIFGIAAATDFLDGNIARKYNIVTNFGKFMDPLADKVLVLVAMILIVDGQLIPVPYIASIALIVTLTRELVVSGVRLLGANNGIVIAADKLGKIKTATQCAALPILLIAPAVTLMSASIGNIVTGIGVVILLASTVICVISGIQYVTKNIDLFKDAK